MNEIWKDIIGFEGIYQISNYGRVKSLARYSQQKHLLPEKILQTTHVQAGYVDVSLYKDGVRYHRKIHKLVAEAFIPNPNNLPEVDHIDANKDNNYVGNLRWVTHKENCLNPNRRELLRKINLGKKRSLESIEKNCKKIGVFLEDKLIATFNSYKDLDNKSQEILGRKLWGYYVRKVIQGKREDYFGYKFQLLK